MALARIGSRRQAGGEAAVDMTPVVGADFLRMKTQRLNGVDHSQHALDLDQPKDRSRISAPGLTQGTVEQGSPARQARKMSMRETSVP